MSGLVKRELSGEGLGSCIVQSPRCWGNTRRVSANRQGMCGVSATERVEVEVGAKAPPPARAKRASSAQEQERAPSAFFS